MGRLPSIRCRGTAVYRMSLQTLGIPEAVDSICCMAQIRKLKAEDERAVKI